jgi:hypothetical protein
MTTNKQEICAKRSSGTQKPVNDLNSDLNVATPPSKSRSQYLISQNLPAADESLYLDF